MIDWNLVLRVRMLLYSEMALVLLSTSSCKPVTFSWKSRTLQSMNSVDNKVERSIGADIVPLICKGNFVYLVTEVFNAFSWFVREPHSSSLVKNARTTEELNCWYFLDNGTEDLVTIGPIPEEFLDILAKIKYDGCEHRLSSPSNIVAVKAAYSKKTFFSVPNLHRWKVLDPLEYFIIFDWFPFI